MTDTIVITITQVDPVYFEFTTTDRRYKDECKRKVTERQIGDEMLRIAHYLNVDMRLGCLFEIDSEFIGKRR